MARVNRPENFWLAFFAICGLVLAGVIMAEYEFGRVTVGEGVRAPAKVAEARLLPPFSFPADLEASSEMVSRPLFVPTRRPSPPASAAAASTMKRGQFVLTGVSVTPEVSIAFLKDVSNGKTQSIKKGAQVNGMTVETVEPRRVVLRQGDEVEDLALNVQVPARVATAPAAPTMPPGAARNQDAQSKAPASPASGAPPPGAIGPQGLPAGAGIPQTLPGAQPVQPGSPAAAPATGRRRPWIRTQ